MWECGEKEGETHWVGTRKFRAPEAVWEGLGHVIMAWFFLGDLVGLEGNG